MPHIPLSQARREDRERPIELGKTALLSIDMQNAEWSAEMAADARATGSSKVDFLDRLEHIVIPNQVRLQSAAREAGLEVIYTVIEALTKDGRDISLDHKISGLFFPKGSLEAKVIPAVAPADDEILIPKTASGIFNCTNIEYVLRNMGIEYVVIYGVCTDQCVETAVRDACDRGFLVTQVEDCCAADDPKRHERSIQAMGGHYCRMRTTDEMLKELASMRA